jgi:hypothetical protein
VRPAAGSFELSVAGALIGSDEMPPARIELAHAV